MADEGEAYTPPERKPADNRTTKIARFLGDGDYVLTCGSIGAAEELQERLGCGPFELYSRLASFSAKPNDVPEVLRIGLIGGGMDEERALRLVQRYVAAKDVPLGKYLGLAEEVMQAAIIGVEDEPIKKDEGEETETDPPPSPTEN